MWIRECRPTSGGGHYLYLQTLQVWWGSMHAISSYRGNRPTNKQTQPQTHRQDRFQYTAPQLACSVMTSFVDGQPRLWANRLIIIISLHCAHCALTHDTMPLGSGRGTSPRITKWRQWYLFVVSHLVFEYLIALVVPYGIS